MIKLHSAIKAAFVALAATMLVGCSVPKDVAYFQDTDTSAIIENVNKTPIKVAPGDKLAIVVKTKDPTLSALFNMPVYSNRIGQGGSTSGTSSELRSYSGSTAESVASYNVTPEGTIDFPILGYIHVGGMTRSEVAAFIKGELEGRELAKNPTVAVEFLNSGISVLGEVNNPGRYDLNRDDLNVLEALSLAGDLGINGQRQNVKVLRKEGDKMVTYTLDLTDASKLMTSPAFYLRQNDVIYVEPNKMRKRSTTINANNTLSVGFWMSVASVLTSVVTTIAVFVNK